MHEHELHHLQQPFREAASGKQAYGVRRYLDIAPSQEGQFGINLAYDPHPAYNDVISCPWPPENRLRAPIHAGEAT